MRIFLFLLMALFLLTGCGNNESANASTDTSDSSETEYNSTNKETTSTNQSSTQDSSSPPGKQQSLTLEVERPDMEPLKISLDLLPKVLEYLKEYDDTIDRISSQYLFQANNKDYFVVGYNCGVKECDRMLVEYDPESEKTRTLDLTEFAAGFSFEKWDSYIAFLFALTEGSYSARHKIVVVNLQDWGLVNPPKDISFLGEFTYPITNMKQENGTLKIDIADVPDTLDETIHKWWLKDRPPVRQIEWKIN